jgi:hypothetical protein
MSFFTLSSGSQVETQDTFDMGGGDITPIPTNTQVKAYCEEAAWSEYQGDRYINLKWEVIEGEYKSRKIFQKIKVCDTDSKKRDKALTMLSAIDTNTGGGLMRLGQEPNDMDLQTNLCNKPMALKIMVWALEDAQTGEKKTGNWIGAVAPLNRAQTQPAQQAAPTTKPSF